MSEISIDRTVWSGFRVAAGNPAAFGLWIVVYAVCGMGPSLLLWALMGPDFLNLMQAGATGAQPDMAAFTAAAMRMQAISGLSTLGALILYPLIYCAVFRAVLQPDKRKYGFLRVGMEELLVGLMIIALYIGLFVLAFVAALVGVIGVGATAATGSGAAAVVVGLIFGIAVVAGVLWLTVRLSLLLPMTFATKTIEIGKAWSMTRGRTGRLLLIAVILFLVVMGMGIVIFGIFGAVGLAALGSIGDGAAIKSFFSRPAAALIRDLTPWGVVIGLVSAVYGTLQLAVSAAPWAEAYREIVDQDSGPVEVF